ncbi:MAG: hypothetical protein HQK77_18635, partial [Desulfobacterales bacterium]|nr:hypothetical protein [Desulfobacterales bacterium]
VYTIKYFSVDNSTNTETVKTAVNTVNIDKTDPTGSISVDSGATYTDTTSVTLTLSATDDLSGMNQMKVSEDPLFAGVPWEAYNASKGFTLSGGDGVKTVYVMYQDLATNQSIVYSDTITLDQTGPTGSITIDAGATYTNLLTASLSHSADDGSGIGVNEMMLSEDPAFAGAAWEAYNASSTFTISAGDGVKTIYIKFRDTLNNEGPTYSDTIILDQTGPTGSVIINSGDTYTHHTTVTLTISATDVTSLVDEMMVSESPTFVGGVWEAYDTSIWFDMAVGDGVKTIYIKFKDILGNEGGSYSDTITLDQTNPTINITDLGLIDDVPDQSYLTYYFTSQTPFIQGMTEANSMVHFEYGSNDYTTLADSTGHYGISIEGPSLPRTSVTLKYHAVDLAGNLSGERTLVLIIGIENFPQPEVTSTPSITPSITLTVTPSTTITPTITEIPQTGDITSTPILPTIVIYKIEGGDGTLLVGAIVTIDGQEYVSDERGQIYVQGRPDANPMVTIEYNGEVLSANISGSNIMAGEAIPQNTNIIYLFLILLMILLAGGGYAAYRHWKK